jgi:hypothetical protein
LIEQYESDGHSKSVEANGSRNQRVKHEFNFSNNWDAKQELYETPIMGITLELISL